MLDVHIVFRMIFRRNVISWFRVILNGCKYENFILLKKVANKFIRLLDILSWKSYTCHVNEDLFLFLCIQTVYNKRPLVWPIWYNAYVIYAHIFIYILLVFHSLYQEGDRKIGKNVHERPALHQNKKWSDLILKSINKSIYGNKI